MTAEERKVLKEKVLQTFVVTVREINKFGGPKEFFEKYPVGAMYYCYSAKDVDFTKETSVFSNPDYLMECRKYSKIPLLVCADYVPLPGQKYGVSVRSLGGSKNEEHAYNCGKIMGMQCNANDIDWILQPAIDMYYKSSMPFYALSGDVEVTAKMFRQIVKGLQDQGVCATVKHFPGLGTDNTNMHHAPGTNVLPFDEWMNSYGYTYKEMFKENACSVMTTHTMLQSYDDETHDGFLPIATYSKKLSMDLLKGELGFEGAIVTDALIMGGMATGDLVAETVQAFKSGADFLLWPPMEAADKIVELLESGEIPMSRLDDALARIGKMRSFRAKALAEKTYDEPDADFANAVAKESAREGICLYKNELNLIPLSKEVKKILILNAMRGNGSEMMKTELEKRGYRVDVTDDIYDHEFYVCWQDDIDEIASQYDMVILNANPGITDDTHNPLFMMIWASHLFHKQKKIVINYGKPFVTLNYFPEELTVIEANAEPSELVVQYIVDGLVGEMEFTGEFVL